MDMSKYSGKYTTAKINCPEVDWEQYLNKKVTNEFFPDTGHWFSSCFKKPKDLSIEYLPCHLDNDKWLAKMIMNYCSIPNAEYKKVLDYVKTSDLFYKKKKEYALKIINWQIDFIRSGREGYVLKKEHGTDFWQLTENCYKTFRWAVIDTLEAIGMNRSIIEEGLEKYSDDWRNGLIEHAFINKYNSIGYNFLASLDGENLPEVNEEFKKAWIAVRKYEYYMEHRESVELYGKIEPEMQMSSKEYNDLKAFVSNEVDKRISEIKQTNSIYNDDNKQNTLTVEEQEETNKNTFIKRFKSKFKHKDK